MGRYSGKFPSNFHLLDKVIKIKDLLKL